MHKSSQFCWVLDEKVECPCWLPASRVLWLQQRLPVVAHLLVLTAMPRDCPAWSFCCCWGRHRCGNSSSLPALLAWLLKYYPATFIVGANSPVRTMSITNLIYARDPIYCRPEEGLWDLGDSAESFITWESYQRQAFGVQGKPAIAVVCTGSWSLNRAIFILSFSIMVSHIAGLMYFTGCISSFVSSQTRHVVFALVDNRVGEKDEIFTFIYKSK